MVQIKHTPFQRDYHYEHIMGFLDFRFRQWYKYRLIILEGSQVPPFLVAISEPLLRVQKNNRIGVSVF